MVRREVRRGLFALLLGWMLAACGTETVETAATATSAPPPQPATGVPSPSLEPTPEEPSTPTPGLPTPVADPVGRLTAGEGISIQFIQMLDVASGWAVARSDDDLDHIVRTSDGGATWTDVSPPEYAGSLDAPRRATLATSDDGRRAWVLYSGAMDLDRDPITVVVWRTADSGATWLPSTLIEAPFGSGWFEPLSLDVLDDGFGWLMAAIDAGMMHQYIALYTTQDSGGTWVRVLDPYAQQPVHSCPKTGLEFADASVGWMTRDCGGLIDQVTVITTSDGGVEWVEMPVPPPSGLPEGYTYPYLCAPHSINLASTRAGTLAVSCSQYLDTPGPEGETKRYGPHALYRTQDGGLTWEERDYPGGQLLWLDASHGWALGRDIYRTGDGGQTWEFVHRVNWDGQFSFVGESHGWAVARTEEDIALVRTRNGGASWVILKPVIGP